MTEEMLLLVSLNELLSIRVHLWTLVPLLKMLGVLRQTVWAQ